MAATREEISQWFDAGIAKQATHMLVVCDTFDYEDYPVYVMPGENPKVRAEKYIAGDNMQRLMECYKLDPTLKEAQMQEHRARNFD